MVDGDSKPFSIERCRLVGTENSGLSDEEIEAIRVQTDAWTHVLLDIYCARHGIVITRSSDRDHLFHAS